ncbi:unnamed protein product [Durusdinium trenchii]|uniref:Uncharacterized protein n=1 Tax=Durusdinium trenchii TaxID=1381693 RepID=A0ABP0PPV9_9DINO
MQQWHACGPPPSTQRPQLLGGNPPSTLRAPPSTLRAGPPPSTLRPGPPPSTLRAGPPSAQRLGPPPTQRPERPSGISTPPAPPSTVRPQLSPPPELQHLGPAGAKTLNWYVNRPLHPRAGAAGAVPFTASGPEEELDLRLQLEAECDGVESRGYVHSEVINEHPSELPDFDRRMWVVDPFYGWRTQDPEVDFDLRRKPLHLMPTSGWTPEVCKLPPDATTGAKLPDAPRRSGREAVGDGAEADAATEEPPTSAPARTWIQWLTGTSAPAPPSPPPPKPPLPSGRQMMPSKQDPVPDEPPQRPLPSWPELRQLLEPEMNAAGIAWEDVDDHLWNELLSVGELRRAVQRPKEFPDRLAQLSARVSNEDTVKIEALLSPSKRKKAQPQTPPQTLPPPRVPLPPQDSAPTSAVPAAPARLPPKQVPQEPEITAGGVADPLAKPVWTPQDDSAPAPEEGSCGAIEDLEQKPKKKKKDKSKKGKKEEDGCHVS